MKKAISVILSLLMVISMLSVLASVSAFAEGTFTFEPMELVKGDDDKTPVLSGARIGGFIYGFKEGVKADDASEFIAEKGAYSIEITGLDTNGYLGTGNVISVKNAFDVIKASYTLVIFGDLNGDGFVDALDARYQKQIAQNKDIADAPVAAEALELAADANLDGVADAEDYSAVINSMKAGEDVDQHRGDSADANALEATIPEQEFDGGAIEPDVAPNFSGMDLVEGEDYTVTYTHNEETGEATATYTGIGLYSGTYTTTFKITSVLEKTSAWAQGIVENLNLADFATIAYDNAAGEKVTATINVDALAGDGLSINESALDGFLGDLKAHFHENYDARTITVGAYEIAANGAINYPNFKALVLNAAAGCMTDLANATAGVPVRSYTGSFVTDNGTEDFTLELVFTGEKFDKVKTIAAKIANYVSFSNEGDVTTINVKLPQGVANKVIKTLAPTNVSVADAYAAFNGKTVNEVLQLLAFADASDFSTTYASDIEKLCKIVGQVDGLINKVLDKISGATIYDVNGVAYTALSGEDFAYDANTSNPIAMLVASVAGLLSEEVRASYISSYSNGDGTYTVKLAGTAAIGSHSAYEEVVINLDIFDL